MSSVTLCFENQLSALSSISRNHYPANQHRFLIGSHTQESVNASNSVNPINSPLQLVNYCEETSSIQFYNIRFPQSNIRHLLTFQSSLESNGVDLRHCNKTNNENDANSFIDTSFHVVAATSNSPKENKLRFFTVTPPSLNEDFLYQLNSPFSYSPLEINALTNTKISFNPIQRIFSLPTQQKPETIQLIILLKHGPSLIVIDDNKHYKYVFKNLESLDKGKKEYISGAADPHHRNSFATVGTHGLDIYDTRCNGTNEAHTTWDIYNIQETIDYNPNRQYELLTGGEDGSLRFWDTRKLDIPVHMFRKIHSLYITNTKYNAYYDPIVVTSGCDCTVNLWNVDFLRPLATHVETREQNFAETPARIYSSTIHNDTISHLCWSDNDPWVFASIGYDNKFVIHQIPYEERYKILM